MVEERDSLLYWLTRRVACDPSGLTFESAGLVSVYASPLLSSIFAFYIVTRKYKSQIRQNAQNVAICWV